MLIDKLCCNSLALFLCGQAVAAAWTIGPELSIPRADCGACVDSRGNIYAVGGRVTWSPGAWTPDGALGTAANAVEKLDQDTMTWEMLPELNVPREGAAVVCRDGFIYVIGGRNCFADVPCEFYDTVERLDLFSESAEWEMLPATMNTARSDPGVTVDLDGRVYVAGGNTSGTGDPTDTVERYDPARPHLGWVELTPLPIACSRSGAATDRLGRIYIIGGGINFGAVDSVWRLDPLDCPPTWSEIATIPADLLPTQAVPMAVGADGRFYTAGGNTPQGPWRDRCIRFDPETKSWEQVASMSELLMPSSNGMVVDLEGRIWLVGGIRSGPAPSDTVQYLEGPFGADEARPVLLDINADARIDVFDLLAVLELWGS